MRTLIFGLGLLILLASAGAQDDLRARQLGELEQLRAQLEELHDVQMQLAEQVRTLMNRTDELVRDLRAERQAPRRPEWIRVQSIDEEHPRVLVLRREGEGPGGIRVMTEARERKPDQPEVKREHRTYRVETIIGPEGRKQMRVWRDGREIDPQDLGELDIELDFDWGDGPRIGRRIGRRIGPGIGICRPAEGAREPCDPEACEERCEREDEEGSPFEGLRERVLERLREGELGQRLRRLARRLERLGDAGEHRELEGFFEQLGDFLEEMPWDDLEEEAEFFLKQLQDHRRDHDDDGDEDRPRIRRPRGRWF
jgi:hypothetical protein